MLIGILEKTAKEVAKAVGKSAASGAITDGVVGAASGKNPLKEAACGATSAAAGALAKEGFEHFVKSTGPAGLIVGVSTSIFTRYVFRRTFADTEDTNELDEGSSEEEIHEKR